jgi:tetratricopeptide (TPR) repeat protein
VEDRQQDFERDVAAALKINPRYGAAYRVAGDKAASNYRFAEAALLTRKALELDADEARTHSALGGHLMRTGDEQEARNALERAFKSDPFDTSTYNMLNLLDTLDKFETIREGDFIIRLDPREAPVMKEYVGPLAARAMAALSKKYQFTVQGPILIEMFPRHDDFAVRTIGLPGFIGALGACFGRVVTLDSPKARPPGEFIWGETLWHELVHVATLQLSNQRVPRWLTEGMSVYEEKFGSPHWGREGELSFVQAYARSQIMSLRDLNAGFTDPEKISLAYYEGSLVVEHIVATYGEGGLRKLLVGYGKGLEGEAAIKEGLGVDLDTLQAGFDQMLEAKYGSMVKALTVPKEMMLDPKAAAAGASLKLDIEAIAAANPGSFPAQVALGEFLWKAERLDEAFKTLERAAQMVPIATGGRSPHAMMAQMALQQKNRQRAITELEALLQHAHSDLDSARLLAKLLEEEKDQARLFTAYERIVGIDPFDASAHASFGRLALQRQDAQLAVREFRGALAAGALDPAVIHTDLAESYLALGDKVQARREALAAIEIAPGYQRAQQLLLKLVGGN